MRKPVKLPPEEKFWKRYSPQHEFPISSVTSICLYALAFLLCWVVISYAVKSNDDNKSLPVENIAIAGGGGSLAGEGAVSPGDLPPKQGKEAVEERKPEATAPAVPDEKLTERQPDPLDLPELQVADARIIDDPALKEAVDRLGKLDKEARKQLFQGVSSPGPSKGLGGSGEGGGKGKGKGKGEGDLEGDGKGKLNVRQKRVLRWVMLFNTLDGNDYLRQLNGLGAILAIPDPQGGYMVIRNLTKLPATGQREELADIKRIFWIDDKRQSVESLSRALRLPFAPPHIVAFFPEKLEKELLDKELKYRGRKEDDIRETQFRVERRGGVYEPRVESQR
jgi:hypothetical protein